jgi:glycosyltransferase involved in cell wall biosynthesis
VIIVHGIIFPWQVLMLRFVLGRKITIIAQHHAERPFRDMRQYIQRWADRFISAYLFCSIEQAKPWIDSEQISDIKKVKEIMGTSSSFYPIDKSEARSRTSISGHPVYLWVGGLDSNKDPLTVVKAFINFSKINPIASLYMVYQTDQLLGQLRGLISESENIHLVGEINNPELLFWFNSADFIISSSYYEGSGIAVCEGLSCGCIPILTNIPSFRMMTDLGRIGFLYQAGNENELLAVLQKSLTINQSEEREKVLDYFIRELSFEANARKIMNVINEIRS